MLTQPSAATTLTSKAGITSSKKESSEVSTSIVVEDPTAPINTADTCIFASSEVISIAIEEHTIVNSEISTVLSSDDDEPLMFLSEVAEIEKSPSQMDVPAVQEEKNNAMLVGFIGDSRTEREELEESRRMIRILQNKVKSQVKKLAECRKEHGNPKVVQLWKKVQ